MKQQLEPPFCQFLLPHFVFRHLSLTVILLEA